MKKIFVCLICLLLITGCNKKEETKAFNCKFNEENETYKKEAIYNVQYRNDYVTAVIVYENIASDDKIFLNDYYEKSKEKYKQLNSLYGNHLYNIGKSNTNVTIEVGIDYSNIDINLLLQNDETLKNHINNNKLTVSGIRDYYSSIGFVCE